MLLDPLQSRALFQHALARHYAILAVNADSPAAVNDCVEAALQCDAPVIIETSLWQLTGRSFGAGDPLLGLARYLADLVLIASSKRYLTVPVVLHTDHIKGPDTLRILGAAICGLPLGSAMLRASTISLDSSGMSEEENIGKIGRLCELAAEAGVPLTVEMEAGVDDGVTKVESADRLLGVVERQHPGNIHLWAPGVGTQHGLADSGERFSIEAVRAHKVRASELCGRPVGIALHGSSGLPEADLRAAVEAGVAKVNWSSESLLIRSEAAREYYASRQAELDKRHKLWKATAMDHGVQSFVSARYLPKVVGRMRLLRGAGQGAGFVASLSQPAGFRGQ